MRVGVVGAGAGTAPNVLAELIRRGYVPVAVSRSSTRMAQTVSQTLDAFEPRARIAIEQRVVPDDSDSDDVQLAAALEDVDAVVHIGAPSRAFAAAAAAVAAGRPFVDAAGVHPHHRQMLVSLDAAARSAGVSVVIGAGAAHLVGDLLGEIALGAVRWPRELHVTGVVASSGGIRAALTAGGRAALVDLLSTRAGTWHDGHMVEEAVAEARRLAWFPRPVGPHHAIGVGGLAPLVVPPRHPTLTTVRSYLAVPGWQAELVQALGTIARSDRGRRFVARRLDRHQDPDPARRASTRWAVVAEASTGVDPAAARDDDGVPIPNPDETLEVARAWANGHDPVGLTAIGTVAVLEALMAPGGSAGICSPAALGPPVALLDVLAARSDLRWSVIRPDSSPSPS